MTTKTITEAQPSLRYALAAALHAACNPGPEADGYTLSQRMMSVHGAPTDSSYLDASDMILLHLALPDNGLELTTAVVNPLDVERLARALGTTVFDADLDPVQFYAEKVAAEYARLTSSPTAEESWEGHDIGGPNTYPDDFPKADR